MNDIITNNCSKNHMSEGLDEKCYHDEVLVKVRLDRRTYE